MLTGESVPVGKRTPALDRNVPMADRTNMAYMGTIVAAGRGRGYVVATGAHTELGAIATSVREEESPKTPLQHRMDRFARVVGIVVLVSAVAAFGAGVAMGNTAAEMFKVAVALAVSAIPEGLPVVFTIALALGVRRMARRNAIIRRLPAVETLGSTTVIGSDKTGTLTENRMTVKEVWAGGRFVDVDEAESTEPGGDPLRRTMLAGVLTNEAEAYRGRDGLQVKGDPTEAALLVAAARLLVEPPEVRARYRMVAEIPFEPERRYSAGVREHEGDHLMFVKGAPERVATMCEQILTDDGPRRLDHEEVHRAAREMAGRGLRVLAMAYKELSEPPVDRDEGPVVPPRERLVFLGLQGMLDPPREGVKEAIAACRSAGIRVVMITGDHAVTARSIAVELGITPADPEVLTGVELEDLDDDGLRERVATVSVYARVSPEHKLRVVRALRARGEVVAVTGDGVNDAPALKAADIGVAMGRSGTDVAREASDMVLSDDNFVSIRAAVEEGRVTFDNVRKVTFFLISSGAAEVLTIVTALLLGWPLPLLAVQILWLNLVTNGIQDVALAFEPGEPDVLQRPPRPRLEGVVSALLWERTVVAGAVMATGVLVLYRWELDHGAGLIEARTVALTSMVLFQALHAGNSRSEHRSVFAISPFSNRFLLAGVLAALAIHAVALYLPVTRFVLRVEPLAINRWLEAAVIAISIIVAIEIHKLVRRPARSREGG
jgi:Ca2+-transporting ATPase